MKAATKAEKPFPSIKWTAKQRKAVVSWLALNLVEQENHNDLLLAKSVTLVAQAIYFLQTQPAAWLENNRALILRGYRKPRKPRKAQVRRSQSQNPQKTKKSQKSHKS